MGTGLEGRDGAVFFAVVQHCKRHFVSTAFDWIVYWRGKEERRNLSLVKLRATEKEGAPSEDISPPHTHRCRFASKEVGVCIGRRENNRATGQGRAEAARTV